MRCASRRCRRFARSFVYCYFVVFELIYLFWYYFRVFVLYDKRCIVFEVVFSVRDIGLYGVLRRRRFLLIRRFCCYVELYWKSVFGRIWVVFGEL